jgi:hypothetical protein
MAWNLIIPAAASLLGGAMANKGAKDAANTAAQGTQQKMDPRMETALFGGNIEGVYHPGALDHLRHQFQKGTPAFYPGELVARQNPFHQAGYAGAMQANNMGLPMGGFNAVNQYALGVLNKGKQPGDAGYTQFQSFTPPKIDEEAFWKMYNAPPPNYGRQPIQRTANDLQPGMRDPLGDGSNGQGGTNQGGAAPDDGKNSFGDRVKSKLPGSKPSLGKLFGF